VDAIARRVPSLFLIPFVLVFVGVFLGIALLNGQRDLTILCLILFCIVAAARTWTRFSMNGLDCRVAMARRRAFPGEQLLLEATARNRKFLPVWLEARMPIGGLVHEGSPATAVTAETGLLWQQQAAFSWTLATHRRGVYRLGPLHITSGDLFGFFPREKENGETIEVLVYPRLVALQHLLLPKRDFFGIPGPESPVQDPIHILGTRDYQHGRPARYIHWKATARHHRLQEKIFEPTVQEKILLVVDAGAFAPPEAEEAFERVLETAAAAAAWLDQRGCAVGLATNGTMAGGGPAVLPVARAPQQLSALFEAFARLERKGSAEIVEFLRDRLMLSWGLTCLYFTLAADEAARSAAAYLAAKRIPVLFVVARPPSNAAEDRLPGSAAVCRLDALRGGEERG
jgi:uncharacterized protein (DUF58 family)